MIVLLFPFIVIFLGVVIIDILFTVFLGPLEGWSYVHGLEILH